ncbi:hypothetical protein [Calothrix rhizosoleniae]|uniref:hypothetical protein n=1 Tax=Calothrix rhizosoleniae TaxID=888997 RepID=UPI000B497D04|nr:hypothetical protein [Calothrix rhizosoleniae]
MTIDTSRKIAQMPILSLRCVDCLRGKNLRGVFDVISENIYHVFWRCVDLGAETLTGQSLLNELPTDWVKSD